MNKALKTSTCVWKWWVWKSTCAASKAVDYARQWKKTLIIDMDWWKALARVFGQKVDKSNEIINLDIPNLSIASVQNQNEYKTREKCSSFDEYMDQFPEDYWLVCFNSMVDEFFWVSTDVIWIQRFITLVRLIQEAKKQGYKEIIIDVEPTEWFNRLIKWIDRASRSMLNLSETWKVKLLILWAKWPDIKLFLKSKYIKEANYYTKRLLETKKMITEWNFSIVSIPEPDPMMQALNEVLWLVDSINWRLTTIIVNNSWREKPSIEMPCIETAMKVAKSRKWVRLVEIPHATEMFEWDRIKVLEKIWEKINSILSKNI